MKMRLRDSVHCQLEYRDDTQWGHVLGDGIERTLQALTHGIVKLRRKYGLNKLIQDADRVYDRLFSANRLGALYHNHRQIRPEVLYPNPQAVQPTALLFFDPSQPSGFYRWPFADHEISSIYAHLQELQQGLAQNAINQNRHLQNLKNLGFLTERSKPAPISSEGLLYVGHASALLICAGRRILIDPFIPPYPATTPDGYQPYRFDDLEPDVILITHSHPDHYDPCQLMRFHPRAEIVVPRVPRESILAIDMAMRLRQLGHPNVREMSPGEFLRRSPFTINALEFYGEQPTASAVLHPEVRNWGNCYRIDSPLGRVIFLADAGQDHQGHCRQIAEREFQRDGACDFLFGGYRGWTTHPLQYLFSSVGRYLLFVPPEQRHQVQKIMNDSQDLLEVGALWQARTIIPYAHGGAPWYWQLGLGRSLDFSEELAESDFQREDFDPWPSQLTQDFQQHPDFTGSLAQLWPGALLTAVHELQAHQGWPFPIDAAFFRPEIIHKGVHHA